MHQLAAPRVVWHSEQRRHCGWNQLPLAVMRSAAYTVLEHTAHFSPPPPPNRAAAATAFFAGGASGGAVGVGWRRADCDGSFGGVAIGVASCVVSRCSIVSSGSGGGGCRLPGLGGGGPGGRLGGGPGGTPGGGPGGALRGGPGGPGGSGGGGGGGDGSSSVGGGRSGGAPGGAPDGGPGGPGPAAAAGVQLQVRCTCP